MIFTQGILVRKLTVVLCCPPPGPQKTRTICGRKIPRTRSLLAAGLEHECGKSLSLFSISNIILKGKVWNKHVCLIIGIRQSSWLQPCRTVWEEWSRNNLLASLSLDGGQMWVYIRGLSKGLIQVSLKFTFTENSWGADSPKNRPMHNPPERQVSILTKGRWAKIGLRAFLLSSDESYFKGIRWKFIEIEFQRSNIWPNLIGYYFILGRIQLVKLFIKLFRSTHTNSRPLQIREV